MENGNITLLYEGKKVVGEDDSRNMKLFSARLNKNPYPVTIRHLKI